MLKKNSQNPWFVSDDCEFLVFEHFESPMWCILVKCAIITNLIHFRKLQQLEISVFKFITTVLVPIFCLNIPDVMIAQTCRDLLRKSWKIMEETAFSTSSIPFENHDFPRETCPPECFIAEHKNVLCPPVFCWWRENNFIPQYYQWKLHNALHRFQQQISQYYKAHYYPPPRSGRGI